jgi:hypothetical protein
MGEYKAGRVGKVGAGGENGEPATQFCAGGLPGVLVSRSGSHFLQRFEAPWPTGIGPALRVDADFRSKPQAVPSDLTLHRPSWVGKKIRWKPRWQGLQEGHGLRQAGLARFVLHVRTYRFVRG